MKASLTAWVFAGLVLGMIMSPVRCDTTSSTVLTNPAPSPTSTPTEAPPTSTTEDPVQRHLSVIIGVPIGVGLSILLIGSCAVWLFLSSYLKYRREEREQTTHLTNLNSPSKDAASGGRTYPRGSEPGSEGDGAFHTTPDSPKSPTQLSDTKL